MSGQGVGSSPNAAFAASSARCYEQGLTGLSSSIIELQELLDSGNDREFTAAQDRRCQSLEGIGLGKTEKVSLQGVPMFEQGTDIEKWANMLWVPILQHSGGAALQQYGFEQNYLVNRLEPPPHVLHIAVHGFTARDADTATLEAMFEQGELGGHAEFGSSDVRTQNARLAPGDEVELLVELPTEVEEETRSEWIYRNSTIVKAVAGGFLVHSDSNLNADGRIERFPDEHVRRRTSGYLTPQSRFRAHHEEWSTARQVGPYIDKGVLESGVFDPHTHKAWMCFCIYARLSLPAQRMDKTVLPMFLTKLKDVGLREACSTAAGGRFSKAIVKLFGYVGMNPGHQLVMELNATHIQYTDMNALSLAIPKRQLALSKSTAE
jgi:hypothetical protein